MIQKTISQIAKMIQIENDVTAFANVVVKGVCIDTRKIEPGNLFIPFKGENTDGHQFAAKAIELGAAAVLWQKDVPLSEVDFPVIVVEDTLLALQQLATSYRNESKAKIVGITGSNGKTTTKDIAASVLSEKYVVHKTDGNFNNHIGMPLTILGMSEETEIAILEMGMSGFGEIELLTKIARPDFAIITNIGEAHMQDLGSREGIATAKFEIIKGLQFDGVLIYPEDEQLLKKKVEENPQLTTYTFGLNQSASLYANHVQFNEGGVEFDVPALKEEHLLLPIPGEHNVLNSLAVLIVAQQLGITTDAMRSGLRKVALSNMRMEWNQGYKGTKILNDAYNSSPTATKAVISMVENFDEQFAKILVLGDMLELGEHTNTYHFEVGNMINPEKIKYVFTYGPLSEQIAKGAKENFRDANVLHFLEQDALIQQLKDVIEGNEIILVKASRGMKMEKVVAHLM